MTMVSVPPPGDGSNLSPKHREMVDAEVGKGDTEWECLECGHVTTIAEEKFENVLLGGNLATKRCEGCCRIMQGVHPSNERQSFDEWQAAQSEEPETANALEW